MLTADRAEHERKCDHEHSGGTGLCRAADIHSRADQHEKNRLSSDPQLAELGGQTLMTFSEL